jgi:dipeptide transport system permease protein
LGGPGARPEAGSTSAIAFPPSPARELWRDFRRNRGAVIGLAVVGLLVFCALFANLIAPYHPAEQYRDATLRPPSLSPVGGHVFLLGTDPVGRDILSRLIHGTRLSLVIGLVSVGLSLSGGVLLGLVAGFHRGRFAEYAVMRLMDVMLALPSCSSPSPWSRCSARGWPTRCMRSPSSCCRISFA